MRNYLATLHVEQAIVVTYTIKYTIKVFAVGVGDKYLSETVARHQLHNLLHTMRVELVEDIVKQ